MPIQYVIRAGCQPAECRTGVSCANDPSLNRPTPNPSQEGSRTAEVRFEIAEQDLPSCLRAADQKEKSGVRFIRTPP